MRPSGILEGLVETDVSTYSSPQAGCFGCVMKSGNMAQTAPPFYSAIADHPDVVLKYLPKYSPDINPQEQWWNYERVKLLNSRYFDSNRKLNGADGRFISNTPSGIVKSVCNISAIENLLK
jgi:hypothetical protein